MHVQSSFASQIDLSKVEYMDLIHLLVKRYCYQKTKLFELNTPNKTFRCCVRNFVYSLSRDILHLMRKTTLP